MSSQQERKIPKEWDYYRSEEYHFHLKAMESFDRLTEKEKFATLVRAGIINQQGELTEMAGGMGKADSDGGEGGLAK